MLAEYQRAGQWWRRGRGGVGDRVGQETQMCIQQHPVLLSLSVFLARCFCHLGEQNSHLVFLQEFSVRLALERLPTQTSRSERDLLGVKPWRAQKKQVKKASQALSKNVKSSDKPALWFLNPTSQGLLAIVGMRTGIFLAPATIPSPPAPPPPPSPIAPHSQHIIKWHVRECEANTEVEGRNLLQICTQSQLFSLNVYKIFNKCNNFNKFKLFRCLLLRIQNTKL